MLPAVPAAAAVAMPVAAVDAPATAGGGGLLVAVPAGCLSAVRRGIAGGGMSAGPPVEAPASCASAFGTAAVLTPVGSISGSFETVWMLLMSVAAAAWFPAAPAAQATWPGAWDSEAQPMCTASVWYAVLGTGAVSSRAYTKSLPVMHNADVVGPWTST